MLPNVQYRYSQTRIRRTGNVITDMIVIFGEDRWAPHLVDVQPVQEHRGVLVRHQVPVHKEGVAQSDNHKWIGFDPHFKTFKIFVLFILSKAYWKVTSVADSKTWIDS